MCIVCDFADTFNRIPEGDALTIRIAASDMEQMILHLYKIGRSIQINPQQFNGRQLMMISETATGIVEYDHINADEVTEWRKQYDEHKHVNSKEEDRIIG